MLFQTMYPYKLNNFIPELKEILSESQKHLGNMNCIYCLHVHSFKILFFVLLTLDSHFRFSL